MKLGVRYNPVAFLSILLRSKSNRAFWSSYTWLAIRCYAWTWRSLRCGDRRAWATRRNPFFLTQRNRKNSMRTRRLFVHIGRSCGTISSTLFQKATCEMGLAWLCVYVSLPKATGRGLNVLQNVIGIFYRQFSNSTPIYLAFWVFSDRNCWSFRQRSRVEQIDQIFIINFDKWDFDRAFVSTHVIQPWSNW